MSFTDDEAPPIRHGFKVEAYVWYNTSAMDWLLTNDAMLQIRDGQVMFHLEGDEATSGRRHLRSLAIAARRLEQCEENADCLSMDGCEDEGGTLGRSLGLSARTVEPRCASNASVGASPPFSFRPCIPSMSAAETHACAPSHALTLTSSPPPASFPCLFCADHLQVGTTSHWYAPWTWDDPPAPPNTWDDIKCKACEYLFKESETLLQGKGIDALCDAIDEITADVLANACDEVPVLGTIVCREIIKWVMQYICTHLMDMGIEELEKLLNAHSNGILNPKCICQHLGLCGPDDHLNEDPCPDPTDVPEPYPDVFPGIDTAEAAKCVNKYRHFPNKHVREAMILACLRKIAGDVPFPLHPDKSEGESDDGGGHQTTPGRRMGASESHSALLARIAHSWYPSASRK
jgi:hypothetical protein